MKKFFLFVFLFFIFLPSVQAKKAPPEVRILIAENQKAIQLSMDGDYQIRALPSLQIVRKGRNLRNAKTVSTVKGIKLDSDEWAARGFRIESLSQMEIVLNQSKFRGAVDVLKGDDFSLYAINRLDVESYLYGVLHHEVAPWWPMEALKAQAIAARTYALYQMEQSPAAEFDLKSGTSSQVYGGSTSERFRTKKAVDQTAGQVLVYQGKIFPSYFHATCAGRTAGAKELWKIDLPPLDGNVRCDFCRISPHYFWQAKAPLSDIEEKLNKNGRPVGRLLKIEVITQTPSGRVGSLRLTGTTDEAVIAAKDFRIWVGGDRMRSTNFTVKIHEDTAEFSGKGWGHGVGLCQWGTLGQSLLGRHHEQILKFYYPGSEIKKY